MDMYKIMNYILRKGMKRWDNKKLEEMIKKLKPPYHFWAIEELERRKKEEREKNNK